MTWQDVAAYANRNDDITFVVHLRSLVEIMALHNFEHNSAVYQIDYDTMSPEQVLRGMKWCIEVIEKGTDDV